MQGLLALVRPASALCAMRGARRGDPNPRSVVAPNRERALARLLAIVAGPVTLLTPIAPTRGTIDGAILRHTERP